MPQITVSVPIGETSTDLWREIGSFGSVGQWHPMLARVESEGDREGCARIAETRDGKRQTERLLEFAPDRRFYRYRMEATAMPVRNYIGEFRVEDAPDHSSRVVWSAQFDLMSDEASGAANAVKSFLKAGLDHIAHTHPPPPA